MISRIDKMYQSIRQGIKSGNFGRDNIAEIARYTLDTLDLDYVFAASNVDYKYQLDILVSCTKDGIEKPINDHVYLSKAAYEKIVAEYAANSLSEEPIKLLPDSLKSQLHTAVINLGEFYGSAGFGSATKRKWSEEDKEMLDIFAMTVLFYLSFSNLATGSEREKKAFEIATANDVIDGCYIDFATGKCHIIKGSPYSECLKGDWSDYATMLQTLEHKFVDPIYGKRLLETFNVDNLKRTLNRSNPAAAMDFPSISNNKATWLRCEVRATEFDDSGVPTKAVGIAKDVAEEVRNNALLAKSHCPETQRYAVVAGIELDTEKYAVYTDNRPNKPIDENSELYGNYDAVLDYVANSVIDPDYSDTLLEIASIKNMREKFDSGIHKLEFDFPCIMHDRKYWIRLEIVPAQSYWTGNRQVVMYYSDITEVKEQELQLKETRQSLRKERERVAEKEHQLEIDPLTGAYNRIGFEKFTDSLKGSNEPVGFMMIDIDHFKEINDTYGHEAGDITLTKVVKNIKHAFRNEDKVFRIGGDEFAMVLCGCKENAWDSIQAKLASIHTNLKASSKFKQPITLSAGLVISENGFTDDIPSLADDALFITKRNGRAGLTQTDRDGNELHSWNDKGSAAIIPNSCFDIGKWRYEAPLDGSAAPKLFLDEQARFILGIPNTLTPEECYKAWTAALPEKHTNMLNDIQDKAAAVGQAEATHTILNPTLGEIRVRTRVKYSESNGMREFSGHFVALGDESSLPTYDDNQFIIEAMNNTCFSTYYIELETKNYIVLKGLNDAIETADNDFSVTLKTFVDLFVRQDFREDGLKFVDMDTLPERMRGHKSLEYEYVSLSANGWCRSRWLPVKWDDNGDVTHVLLTSESIDETKRAELEQIKRTERVARLQLRVGEMIARTSVVQTGIIDKETGVLRIWLDALFIGDGMPGNIESSKKYGLAIIHPDDRERFSRCFSLDHIIDTVDREGRCDMYFRIVDTDGTERKIAHHYETLDTDPTKLLMAIEEIRGDRA